MQGKEDRDMKKTVFIGKEDSLDVVYIVKHIKNALNDVAVEERYARNDKFGALTVAALACVTVLVAKSIGVTKESIIKQIEAYWDVEPKGSEEEFFN